MEDKLALPKIVKEFFSYYSRGNELYTEEWKLSCLQRFLSGENPFDPLQYPIWTSFYTESKSFLLSTLSKNKRPMSKICYDLFEKSKWTNSGCVITNAYVTPLKHLTDRVDVQPEHLAEIVKSKNLKLFSAEDIFSFFGHYEIESSAVIFASELFDSGSGRFVVGQSSDGLHDTTNDITLSPNTDIVFQKIM